jgi:hypothetical protein
MYPPTVAISDNKPSRRTRTPSLPRLIRQAERSGKTVTSVTRGGVTLSFGMAVPSEANNPWDRS